jgi:pre-mRNA-splicing factor CWC22
MRKTGFKDHPGVIPELDLVELDDQLTHPFDMNDPIDGEDKLNIFREDPFYEITEQ